MKDAPETVVHEVFPDGCVNIVCRRRAGERPQALVVGTRVTPLHTELKPLDYFVGARLSPAAARLVIGGPLDSLFEKNLPATLVLPAFAKGLEAGFGEAESLEAAAHMFEEQFRRLGIRESEVDEAVAVTAQMVEGSFGQEKIGDVATTVGLSTRQLERRFRAVAGLTPKQFSRLRRMYAAAYAVARDRSGKWADRAAEIGYADQAHLTREFVSLTGRSPAALARDLSRIKYGDFVG